MRSMMRVMLGAAGGGGGGGGVLPTIWDDNFDVGSAYDSAGTRFAGANPWAYAFNTGSAAELDLVGNKLRMRITSSTPNEVVIMQTIPPGDFTAFTRCTHTVATGNTVFFGIWVSDGPLYVNQYRCGLTIHTNFAGSYGIGAYRSANFVTYIGTMAETLAGISPWGPYLRLSRSGSTLSFDWSGDGVSWTNVGSWASAFTLSRIGLGYKHERGATTDVCEFDFFAVVNGSAGAALPGSAA